MIAPADNSRGLACPGCGHRKSEVIDSRANDDGSKVRRRRRCCQCDFRWTTKEVGDVVEPSALEALTLRELYRELGRRLNLEDVA